MLQTSVVDNKFQKVPTGGIRYQNVSILDFIGAKNDGGGDMEVVMTTGALRRAKLQSPSETNNQLFYRPDALPVT